MLTVYPSNKLEDLVYLLKAVQVYRAPQSSESKNLFEQVLRPDIILVESKGMQHWLNLELAKTQGIAMNYWFSMPGSFVWDIARILLGDEVPGESPYKREILAWRIEALMTRTEFIEHPDCEPAVSYWGGDTQSPDILKRFQLASSLADVFEQYMLFRPDWLSAWKSGQTIGNDSAVIKDSKIDPVTEKWQAWLWQRLTSEQPCDPVSLQQQAVEAMSHYQGKQLPGQIMIFAVNTMARQTLEFFEAFSSRTDCNIHLFYLNPCVEFWGDVRSDRSLALQSRQQQVKAWLASENKQKTNSLLANLGQQGRAFFNLLQNVQGYEISAFVKDVPEPAEASDISLLTSIQRNILNLSEPEKEDMLADNDTSVVISSSHSELREIQSLHDYLLHQFNAHPDWKPEDVIVMCPAIEDYAPYIESVFRSHRDLENSSENPRLPCSIADRILVNTHPLIAAFTDLLQLPDSRFEVSKIMDYLRLPAIQQKFGFNSDELDTIDHWLKAASVHWGLDARHKKQVLKIPESNGVFTWQWGLERLLLGFAQSDSTMVYEERLLLPHVEGQQAVLLGRLMQLIERLRFHAQALRNSRSAAQWQAYLEELSDDFFAVQKEEQGAEDIIKQAVNSLAENTALADYHDAIDYSVIRYYLQHCFNLPESGNHFMTGQVTFCSMIPMRSIPFKLVAILGLNDGKFPRQNLPVSFNLMTGSGRRPGDRSRREDDRYLFLEALISARHKLYLSYQGRDIRKNSERQPSLVLKELICYLKRYHHWKVPREQLLHPFSKDNYLGEKASFNPHWKRMAQPLPDRNNIIQLTEYTQENRSIALEELVRFFDNPLKEFGIRRLKLKLGLDEADIEDAEPFKTNSLIDFNIRNDFVQQFLRNKDINTVRQQYLFSGQLPDSPLASEKLDELEGQARVFSKAVHQRGALYIQSVEAEIDGWLIEAELQYLENSNTLLFSRPAKRKAKDNVRLWFTHLLASVMSKQPVTTLGLFFNNKFDDVETVELAEISRAEARKQLSIFLHYWQEGLSRPMLLHARLGQALFEKSKIKDAQDNDNVPNVEQIKNWNKAIISGDLYNKFNLDSDAYFKWFYPDTPELTLERLEHLQVIYAALYESLKAGK